MDTDTRNAILTLLKADKQLKRLREQEGEMDMCQALEELYQDGVSEGREAGMADGMATGIRGAIEICQEFGLTKEATVKKLEEKYSLEEVKAREYINAYWK